MKAIREHLSLPSAQYGDVIASYEEFADSCSIYSAIGSWSGAAYEANFADYTVQELSYQIQVFMLALGINLKEPVKAAVKWDCFLAGRVPAKAWTNTEAIEDNLVRLALDFDTRAQVQASDLCHERLRTLINVAERFPVSYNRTLVQGVADYCDRILSTIDEGQENQRQLLNKVRKFASDLEILCTQYLSPYSENFSLLDLQVFEDRFELIQDDSARLGLVPHLREIPAADLVQR